MRAALWVDGWGAQPIDIVGETPKRFRITPVDRAVKLPSRWLAVGQVALVPKYAVSVLKASSIEER